MTLFMIPRPAYNKIYPEKTMPPLVHLCCIGMAWYAVSDILVIIEAED